MSHAKAFSRLFEPAQIGTLRLKNRLVMPPMATVLATDTGAVSDQLLRHYAERAKGGVGLIIVEGTCVSSPVGRGWPCELCLDDDSLVPGHGNLTEVVHSYGAKIAIQLHHAGRATSEAITCGHQPVAPSLIPLPGAGTKPRELTQQEIAELVQQFAAAAHRAERAGYDAVEIHGAHGYLPHQFASEVTNKRSDYYGGSTENRLRFSCQIIEAIKERVGADFPIIYRFSAEGGYTIKDATVFAKRWEEAGVDALHVSAGGIGPVSVITSEMSLMSRPQGIYAGYAEEIKRVVTVPVIAVGEVREPEVAESILETGKADFVAVGRGLLADPQWVNKTAQGRMDDIRRCISCGLCLDLIIRQDLAIRCAVNPAVGRERDFAEITPARERKRVMIAGGGPAGMEAARVAALRGHRVSIYEKRKALGNGCLKLAAAPPHKQRINWLREYLVRQIEKLGVGVNLGTEVSPQLVERISPQVLIVATGARSLIPDIPGIQNQSVFTAEEILEGKKVVEGERVAVLGGRQTGCEVAEWLAEKGYRVTIIMRSKTELLGAGMVANSRTSLLARLTRHKVEVLAEHDVKETTQKTLLLVDNKGNERQLEVDGVVLARGFVPNRELADAVEGRVPEIYIIGDASQPRTITQAIYEGSLIARRL